MSSNNTGSLRETNSNPHQAPTRPTILLVEDEVLLRMMLADELRAGNYTVIEAANGNEAFEVLRAGATIDALVTDVSMPGTLDGARLVALVRKSSPSTRIVIASADSMAIEPGTADAIFPKPYHVVALLRKIGLLLAVSDPKQTGSAET
jgi:CheY-like chemotaxis protein